MHYNVCVHENKCAPSQLILVCAGCVLPFLTCPLLGLLDQDFSSFISGSDKTDVTKLLPYFQVITPTPKTELNKLLNWRADVMEW